MEVVERASEAEAKAESEYLFHLDALPPEVGFSRRLALTGWLFHRAGEPIHGLRCAVRAPLSRERIVTGRRKRARPAIGAAYPNLPEAGMSGFLIEIERMPLGRATLQIEVKDSTRQWRPIFSSAVTTLPLDFLGALRLPNVQRVLSNRLRARLLEKNPGLSTSRGEQAEIHQRLARAAAVSEPVRIETVHLFVTSKSNLFIIEIAQLVCAGFHEAGYAAELFVDGIPAESTPPETIQIVVTPHEFYNLFLTPKLSREERKRISAQLYLLGTEQPDSDWFHSNLVVAPDARAMLDINRMGVEGYRLCGLRCFHLPLGYHALLERTANPVPVERDLDVCLLASVTERREKFLARNADFFAAHDCHLRLVPLGFAKTEKTRSYLRAEDRNAILQRSKLLLNVHYSELRYFEWHRMLIALANGCCIVTETCEGYAPLVPGKHFVMVEADQLIGACEYYLAHSAEREAIARAGRDFIREHLTQAENCRTCLEQIERGLHFSLGKGNEGPPPVPEPPPPELWSAIRHHGSDSLGNACRTDLANLRRAENPQPIAEMSAEDQARTVQSIRQRRRGYAERFARQSEAEARGEAVYAIEEGNQSSGEEAPAISVMVTLFNYQNYIRACVESVNRADLSGVPGGVEILIVDDASTDRSLAEARRAQSESALPVRIVTKKFNTGLADARNVGLRLARAPYVFIMDADNLIFPRALSQLYRAITHAGTAAAYSILCRFAGRPDDRRGLLSHFDWDPRMLTEHPYIDAMALFDRAQLLELGGYDNQLYQIGWFGWEDYELWLRIAAAKRRTVFVPNILCLYRHHESAMSRTTNLFELELVRHLIERYADLLAEFPPKKQVFGVEKDRLLPSESAAI